MEITNNGDIWVGRQNKIILEAKLIVQPVEIHIRADWGTSLESAQVCISCILKTRVLISTLMTSWITHLIGPAKVHVTADAFRITKLLHRLFTNSTWAAHSRRGALRPVFNDFSRLPGRVLVIFFSKSIYALESWVNRVEAYLLSKLFPVSQDVGFEALLATFSFRSWIYCVQSSFNLLIFFY